MGMYDSVWIKNSKGEDHELQFKNGVRICASYKVGDKVPVADAIYFTYEGCFVVFNGIIVAAFAVEDEGDHQRLFMFDKWGGCIDYPELK